MSKLKLRLLFLGVFLASWSIFMVLGVGFIRSAAPTYDEPVHLASGYSVWAGAVESLNYMDHPPFGETWDALPLVFLKPLSFFSSSEWEARQLYHYGDLFLYKNIVPADKMMNYARLWCLVSWGALLCLALLEWSLRLGGPWAMAFAGIFFAFCPPLISNFGLVTTDAPATVFYFLTFWIMSFPRRKTWHWILAGACAGLGLASKFSLIAIPPLIVIGVLTQMRLSRGTGRDRCAQYRPGGSTSFPVGKEKLPWGGLAILTGTLAFFLLAAYRFGDIGQYWDGLYATLTRLGQGRPSFLLGAYSTTGWRLYFPAALAVKTPITILIFAALGAVLWIKAPSLDYFWAAMPPAAYFCAAMLSQTQIGYRYILPVYPFLLVAAAWAASQLISEAALPSGIARSAARVAVVGLCLWLGIGVIRAYPYYLAYFNEFAGGPDGGYRWLVDSNMDWGQDLPALANYLRSRGNPPIVFSYFGEADPAYYGIRYVPLGFIDNVERPGNVVDLSQMKGPILAISVTNLQGVYFVDHGAFNWLKQRKPVFIAGHSIWVYDLNGDEEGRAQLGHVLASIGDGALAKALSLPHG